MSLIISGIVVVGVLVISVVIYILSVIGWYAYRSHILSDPPTNNVDPVQKIRCNIDRRLKPDLITFNYTKKISDDHDHHGKNHDEECSNSETSTTAAATTTQCRVCLIALESEELVRQLPKCKHTFHAPCIDTWLEAHSGCPLCRTVIDRLPSDGDDDVGVTPHDDEEKNPLEVIAVVDNIRTSLTLSILII